jgi:hypothetical protein
MVWRPFYFANLIVDPKNENKIYKPDLTLIMSEDGGKSFSGVGNGAHGDFHDVWVDPDDSNHLIAGDDGGLWYSYDGASSWWKANNLPISQFYTSAWIWRTLSRFRRITDNKGLDGDCNIREESATAAGKICLRRWLWRFPIRRMRLCMPNRRVVTADGLMQDAGRASFKPQQNYGEAAVQLECADSHDSNERNDLHWRAVLFRSQDHTDLGPHFTGLPRRMIRKAETGRVRRSHRHSYAETHTTIYSISESPKDGQTIWVGTDDGNLQVTRDGGKNWTNVVGNIPGLAKSSWVSWVEAGLYDAGTAYAALTAIRLET